MPLIVHPHFHSRHTGVTSHTELIVSELARTSETRALGRHLAAHVPRIAWRELWRRLRQEPLVWHAHRNNEMLVGLLLRLLGRRVRLVYTRHGGTPPGRFTRLLARRAERIITLNEEGTRWMGGTATRIGHGVDVTRFQPPADRDAAWKALGLGGQHGVGVVGRIRPAKGQGDFVEALKPLLEQFPEWRAVLVGQARGKDEGWARALRASTQERLVLAGEHADVVPWYQGLDIIVQPSHSESFGLVLLEAMASGCCLVATRLPHVPALVEHGRTGFLFEPGDVAGLREHLRLLLREPERARAVGRAAAEEARARFGVVHEARALARVYEEALAS
ncbi:MAG: glycosyltransferase family 4 protein [Cystobacter sp.]